MIRVRERVQGELGAHRPRKEAACPTFEAGWDSAQTGIVQYGKLSVVEARNGLLCDTHPAPLVRSATTPAIMTLRTISRYECAAPSQSR